MRDPRRQKVLVILQEQIELLEVRVPVAMKAFWLW